MLKHLTEAKNQDVSHNLLSVVEFIFDVLTRKSAPKNEKRGRKLPLFEQHSENEKENF